MTNFQLTSSRKHVLILAFHSRLFYSNQKSSSGWVGLGKLWDFCGLSTSRGHPEPMRLLSSPCPYPCTTHTRRQTHSPTSVPPPIQYEQKSNTGLGVQPVGGLSDLFGFGFTMPSFHVISFGAQWHCDNAIAMGNAPQTGVIRPAGAGFIHTRGLGDHDTGHDPGRERGPSSA